MRRLELLPESEVARQRELMQQNSSGTQPTCHRGSSFPHVELAEFLEENWVISASGDFCQRTKDKTISGPNYGVGGCKRTWRGNEGICDAFFRCFPPLVAKYVIDIINRNLMEAYSLRDVGKNEIYKYKMIDNKTFGHFFGLYILLEQVKTKELRNLTAARIEVIRRFFRGIRPKNFMGVHRYKTILNALRPTNEEILFICANLQKAYVCFLFC